MKNPGCAPSNLCSVFVPSKASDELKRDDFSVFLICSYSCHKKSTLSKRWKGLRSNEKSDILCAHLCAQSQKSRTPNRERKRKSPEPVEIQGFFLARRKGFEPPECISRCEMRSAWSASLKKRFAFWGQGFEFSQNARKKAAPNRTAFFLARRKGFEPLTFWSVAILLSDFICL